MFPYFPFLAMPTPPLFRPPYPPTCGCSECCTETPARIEGLVLKSGEIVDSVLMDGYTFRLAKDAAATDYAVEADARAAGHKVYIEGTPCGKGVTHAPGYYTFTDTPGEFTLSFDPKENGVSLPLDFLKLGEEEAGEIPAGDEKLLVIVEFEGNVVFGYCKADNLSLFLNGIEEYGVVVNPGKIHVKGKTAHGEPLEYGERPIKNNFNILARKAV